MRQPKFAFVPERQLGGDPQATAGGYRVSIKKNGVIYFPTDVVKTYELEGKYIKFFADVQKKAIGWTVVEGDQKGGFSDLTGVRVMKRASPKSGQVVLAVGKMLKSMGVEKGVEFPNLQVRTYKDSLIEGDVWYVTLDKEAPFVPKE